MDEASYSKEKWEVMNGKSTIKIFCIVVNLYFDSSSLFNALNHVSKLRREGRMKKISLRYLFEKTLTATTTAAAVIMTIIITKINLKRRLFYKQTTFQNGLNVRGLRRKNVRL